MNSMMMIMKNMTSYWIDHHCTIWYSFTSANDTNVLYSVPQTWRLWAGCFHPCTTEVGGQASRPRTPESLPHVLRIWRPGEEW